MGEAEQAKERPPRGGTGLTSHFQTRAPAPPRPRSASQPGPALADPHKPKVTGPAGVAPPPRPRPAGGGNLPGPARGAPDPPPPRLGLCRTNRCGAALPGFLETCVPAASRCCGEWDPGTPPPASRLGARAPSPPPARPHIRRPPSSGRNARPRLRHRSDRASSAKWRRPSGSPSARPSPPPGSGAHLLAGPRRVPGTTRAARKVTGPEGPLSVQPGRHRPALPGKAPAPRLTGGGRVALGRRVGGDGEGAAAGCAPGPHTALDRFVERVQRGRGWPFSRAGGGHSRMVLFSHFRFRGQVPRTWPERVS